MSEKREPEPGRSMRIELATSTVVKVACALGLIWLLQQLWPIILVVGSALMLVGMFSPSITWLERRGIRRSIAITMVFVGLFVALGLFAAVTVPNLVAELTSIIERLPQTQAEIAGVLQKNKLTAPLAQTVRGIGSAELTGKTAQVLLEYSTRAAEIAAYSVTCLFLSLYLIIDRERMRGALFALVPRGHHVRLSRILLNLETIVGGYVRGQLITSIMMAIFTFAVLTIARVPNAVALAAFAGLTDVLPYIGGLLACGPAVFAAWSRGVPAMVAVLLSLAAYQEFESRVIVPRVYGRALRLPPATVMVALLLGGKLLGMLGALLALPVAAAIRMVIEELRFELPGEDVHNTALRRRDEREQRVFEQLAAGTPTEEAAAIATEIASVRMKEEEAEACAHNGQPLK